jgi:uncharacterized membrane protein YkoI
LLKRRIRETRELSCDELVTEKLMDAAVYARSLVHLAGSAVNLNRPGATITVGVADADILEERVMSILRRPNTNSRRRKLLLATAALVFVAPCVAAAPFALSVSINPQAATATPRAVAPQFTEAQAQQDAGQDAKLEMKAREEKRQVELEAMRSKLAELEARRHEEQTKQGVALTQEEARRRRLELEAARIKLAQLEARQREEQATQDNALTQELEAKRKAEREEQERAEREAKERDPEFIAGRKWMQEFIARRQAELAKKANITMQQAIQIAMNQQAGTVMECRLISEQAAGEKDQVFYTLTIVSGDEPEAATTRVLISAVDGRVVRIRKDEK